MAASKKKNWAFLAAVVVGIVLAGAAFSFLPLQEWADAIEAWISGKGIAGDLVFLVIYIVVELLPIPVWMFTLAAGAVFGIVWGFVLVWIGAVAGATIAFILTRYFFRGAAKRMMGRQPILGAVDKALQKDGWQVVALLRLSPIPFGLKNYLFGVTKVRLRDFVLGTAIGKIPGLLVYVVLGATGRAIMGYDSGYKWALVAAGIIAAVAATHLIARAAGKRLGIAALVG